MAEIDNVLASANVALNIYSDLLDYETRKNEKMFQEEQANLNASINYYENVRRTAKAEYDSTYNEVQANLANFAQTTGKQFHLKPEEQSSGFGLLADATKDNIISTYETTLTGLTNEIQDLNKISDELNIYKRGLDSMDAFFSGEADFSYGIPDQYDPADFTMERFTQWANDRGIRVSEFDDPYTPEIREDLLYDYLEGAYQGNMLKANEFARMANIAKAEESRAIALDKSAQIDLLSKRQDTLDDVFDMYTDLEKDTQGMIFNLAEGPARAASSGILYNTFSDANALYSQARDAYLLDKDENPGADSNDELEEIMIRAQQGVQEVIDDYALELANNTNLSSQNFKTENLVLGAYRDMVEEYSMIDTPSKSIEEYLAEAQLPVNPTIMGQQFDFSQMDVNEIKRLDDLYSNVRMDIYSAKQISENLLKGYLDISNTEDRSNTKATRFSKAILDTYLLFRGKYNIEQDDRGFNFLGDSNISDKQWRMVEDAFGLDPVKFDEVGRELEMLHNNLEDYQDKKMQQLSNQTFIGEVSNFNPDVMEDYLFNELGNLDGTKEDKTAFLANYTGNEAAPIIESIDISNPDMPIEELESGPPVNFTGPQKTPGVIGALQRLLPGGKTGYQPYEDQESVDKYSFDPFGTANRTATRLKNIIKREGDSTMEEVYARIPNYDPNLSPQDDPEAFIDQVNAIETELALLSTERLQADLLPVWDREGTDPIEGVKLKKKYAPREVDEDDMEIMWENWNEFEDTFASPELADSMYIELEKQFGEGVEDIDSDYLIDSIDESGQGEGRITISTDNLSFQVPITRTAEGKVNTFYEDMTNDSLNYMSNNIDRFTDNLQDNVFSKDAGVEEFQRVYNMIVSENPDLQLSIPELEVDGYFGENTAQAYGELVGNPLNPNEALYDPVLSMDTGALDEVDTSNVSPIEYNDPLLENRNSRKVENIDPANPDVNDVKWFQFTYMQMDENSPGWGQFGPKTTERWQLEMKRIKRRNKNRIRSKEVDKLLDMPWYERLNLEDEYDIK